MGITIDGINGEQQLFKLLKDNGFDFFQPDAIGREGGDYYIFECKHQAHFTKPPFDGHGLPKWQVEARLKFQERTKIKSILVVFEKPYESTRLIYYQLLEKLDKGEHIDTEGDKPRRIYPLTSFIKITAPN